MNYLKIYYDIINLSKSRGLNKKKLDYYTEKHHIIPRCLNGSNDKINLVLLTAREHFLCHQLLWKANKENKSIFYAYYAMSFKNKNHQRYGTINSKQYEQFKNIKSSLMWGERNPNYLNKCNVGRPKTKDEREFLSFVNKNKIITEHTKELISLNAKERYKNINNHPSFGLKRTEEQKLKMSSSQIGKCNRSIKISIHNKTYDSIKSAAGILKISKNTIRKRLNDKSFNEYLFL